MYFLSPQLYTTRGIWGRHGHLKQVFWKFTKYSRKPLQDLISPNTLTYQYFLAYELIENFGISLIPNVSFSNYRSNQIQRRFNPKWLRCHLGPYIRMQACIIKRETLTDFFFRIDYVLILLNKPKVINEARIPRSQVRMKSLFRRALM